MVELDPLIESILFTILRIESIGSVLDIHHFNILDVFDSKYDMKEISVNLKEVDISLSYDVDVKPIKIE